MRSFCRALAYNLMSRERGIVVNSSFKALSNVSTLRRDFLEAVGTHLLFRFIVGLELTPTDRQVFAVYIPTLWVPRKFDVLHTTRSWPDLNERPTHNKPLSFRGFALYRHTSLNLSRAIPQKAYLFKRIHPLVGNKNYSLFGDDQDKE